MSIEDIMLLERRSQQVIEGLRERVFTPDKTKRLDRRFSMSEAASMVGRTDQTIRDAERDGRLQAPETRNKRRVGYTLEGINAMRRAFGTMPRRGANDQPARVALQNFKGGVGKSTLCVHVAQYMALLGYRVLVVDCDPQASSTSLFGLNPDLDLGDEDTLRGFFFGDVASPRAAVRKTYFDQVDIIPANLGLFDAEYMLAGEVARGEGAEVFTRLREGLVDIEDDYDVIFMDPPPALGMIPLSVLAAANGLLVPVRPAIIDFGSTATFFTMLVGALEKLSEHGLQADYAFVSLLINDQDEGKSTHQAITEEMAKIFGPRLMVTAVMKDSAEIDNATGELRTVYDLDKPMTSRKVHQRCKTYLDAMCREIEVLIRKTWPSHADALRAEGAI